LPDAPFSWGMFGENLTTEGRMADALCIGDRLVHEFRVLEVRHATSGKERSKQSTSLSDAPARRKGSRHV
jgi:MOSC domain-containing protein YiiM